MYNSINKDIILEYLLNIIINIHWKLTEIITYIIVYSNKFYLYVQRYFNMEISNNDINLDGIFYKIYNGNETLLENGINEITNTDFILYEVKINNKKLHKLFTVDNFNINFIDKYNVDNIILSDVNFLLVILIINNEKEDITNILHNINNSFYIVDNKLFTSSFIQLFCKKYTKMKYSDNYTIEILDTNVENIVLKKENYLTITNNNYYIESI